MADCVNELKSADNDWGVKIDGSCVETKSPFLNNDECRRLQNHTSMIRNDWLEYKPYMRWAYLGRELEAQGAGAREITVSRTDNTMSRMREPGEILEIGGFPIGDGSPEPGPGIERRGERREDNVYP